MKKNKLRTGLLVSLTGLSLILSGCGSQGIPDDDTLVEGVKNKPVIILKGGEKIEITVGQPFIDPGYIAKDKIDGDLTSIVIVTGTVDTSKPGLYILTYTVTDSQGYTTIVTRTVEVKGVADIIAPVMSLNGLNPTNLNVGDSYNELGATSIDNIDGDITSGIVITGTVDTTTPGTYTITYTSTDNAGNLSTLTRTINVNAPADITPPVMSLNGLNPTNLNVGDTYNELGATSIDNIDGDITSGIVVTGTVDTTTVGTYTITYTSTDNAGNVSTLTRTVNVTANDVVKKTGQVISYDENGQVSTTIKDDGFYKKGISISYVNSSDIVTDNVTGLKWQDDISVGDLTNKHAVIDGIGGKLGAEKYCAQLSLGGQTWRAPFMWELMSTVDRTSKVNRPAWDNTYFKHDIFHDNPGQVLLPPSEPVYLSLSVDTDSRFGASADVRWKMKPIDGRDIGGIYVGPAGNLDYVRCVTGTAKDTGINPSQRSFTGTDVITDNKTGLEWTNDIPTVQTKGTWKEAIDYCESFTGIGGNSDWRLPNLNEWWSIIDKSKGGYQLGHPAMDPLFTNVKDDHHLGYWTSTTMMMKIPASDPTDAGKTFYDWAWVIGPEKGSDTWGMKKTGGSTIPSGYSPVTPYRDYHFMCVRNK